MAYFFNGATHQIARADAVVTTWPLTMHARVRIPSSDGLEHLLLGLFAATSDQGFYLRIAFTGGTFKARMASRDGSTNASATSTTSLTVGQWHSVVGEVTGATYRDVFIDNAGSANNIISVSPGTPAKTSIGAYNNNGTLSSNVGHEVADVALWSGLLSAGDRAALAAGVSPALIRPHLLELYVPLIRGGQDRMGGEFTISNATVADHPRVYMPS
jgi:hypothetical protein